jgi:hypothetical protein
MKVAAARTPMVKPALAESALMVSVPVPPAFGKTATVLLAVTVKMSIFMPGADAGSVTEYAVPALVTATLPAVAGMAVPLACVPVELAAIVVVPTVKVPVVAIAPVEVIPPEAVIAPVAVTVPEVVRFATLMLDEPFVSS